MVYRYILNIYTPLFVVNADKCPVQGAYERRNAGDASTASRLVTSTFPGKLLDANSGICLYVFNQFQW
jgi:hypothetical protein